MPQSDLPMPGPAADREATSTVEDDWIYWCVHCGLGGGGACPSVEAAVCEFPANRDVVEHGEGINKTQDPEANRFSAHRLLLAAAAAVVRDALDAVAVHPCDQHNDAVRASGLSEPMRSLYDAIANFASSTEQDDVSYVLLTVSGCPGARTLDSAEAVRPSAWRRLYASFRRILMWMNPIKEST